MLTEIEFDHSIRRFVKSGSAEVVNPTHLMAPIELRLNLGNSFQRELDIYIDQEIQTPIALD